MSNNTPALPAASSKVKPPLRKTEVIRAAAMRLIEVRVAEKAALAKAQLEANKERDELRRKEAVAWVKKNAASAIPAEACIACAGSSFKPAGLSRYVYPNTGITISIPRSDKLMALEIKAATLDGTFILVPTLNEAIKLVRAKADGLLPEAERVSAALKDKEFSKGVDAMLAAFGLTKPLLTDKTSTDGKST